MPRKDLTRLDNLDKQILRNLQRDGHLTLEKLTRRLPIGISAVKSRVRRLQEFGLLQKGWLVSLKNPAMPYRLLVQIFLNTYYLRKSPSKNMVGLMRRILNAPRKDARFREQVNVIGILEVLGECDLVVELSSTDVKVAGDFIITHISGHPGVTRTNTLVSILWAESEAPR